MDKLAVVTDNANPGVSQEKNLQVITKIKLSECLVGRFSEGESGLR